MMVAAPFRKSAVLMNVLRLLYYCIPVIAAFAYIYIIINVYTARGVKDCLKVLIVPFVTLVLVTVFRKGVNADRPGNNDGIEPLIPRAKKGESFPSRHTACLGIIAMAGLFCNVYIGIALWLLTVIQGAVRIIAGAHYPKDIFSGMVVSVVLGLMFYL
jgi:membrane-associated phospholipid phosphatase